jgi:hypothetical protein
MNLNERKNREEFGKGKGEEEQKKGKMGGKILMEM